MPLTLAATALVARVTTGISWGEAFLVGAVLSPTDPVFAASLINSPKIPEKVRFLLNVESGVNDGLALPVVLLLIGMLGTKEPDMGIIGWELVEGLLLGTAVPWLALSIENRVGFLGAHRRYLSLLGFALIALVFCAARLLHANEFFASFAAGLTVASFRRNALDTILSFSEQLGELLKLGALMLFGASLVRQFGAFTFGEILFVALAVLLVRPAAIWLTLLHSGFTKRERLVIGFFGPKGFASVVFGLLVLNMGVPNSAYLFRLIALTVASSIILLSTVDILAPGWLVDEAGRRPTGGSRGTPRRKPSA
jgi:NhaP-type Na+/H+ or K+/H+ antiporter